ncbi:hypothetical protein P344_03395 [Spiroplasma mirum ATCC 29335]|uniref:ABC-2 type transporter domain-containing protein n=1 Tax=Spiroplasma mirum ATCC 29335 TaxID=838561 RepID=W6ALH0_9MOLU|nr:MULTISPECIES: hypothetical protein [Spiroplasma]AHI58022.1 hypothetical protein P344_03395 [Spiroplasma mirum ATCC 29335]AKM53102.1 hypothetical protein SATRI_v1c06300 [Spiroplasma atrichopogonis]
MKNEQKVEQNTLIKKKINKSLVTENVNIFALYFFFLNYLKRQKIVFVIAVILIPIGITLDAILNNPRISAGSISLGIGISFIATTASCSMYMMLGFLIDLKVSIVYKRIGLLGIKPLGFILMASLYCITLVVVSDILVLITSLITVGALGFDFSLIYDLTLLLFFIVSIFTVFCVMGILLLTLVLINSRTIQSLVTGILSVIFIGGSFAVASWIPLLFGHNYQQIFTSSLGIGIFFIIIISLSIIGLIFYYLTLWLFKWDN